MKLREPVAHRQALRETPRNVLRGDRKRYQMGAGGIGRKGSAWRRTRVGRRQAVGRRSSQDSWRQMHRIRGRRVQGHKARR